MLAKPEAVTLYLALWDRQRKAFYRSSPRAQNLAQEIKRMALENMAPVSDDRLRTALFSTFLLESTISTIF